METVAASLRIERVVMVAAVVLACALALPAATQERDGQNWPSFRGPNASGVADVQSLPTVWDSRTSVNMPWKTSIPGLAHSSPIVWGSRVFLTTAISSEPKPEFSPKAVGPGMARDRVKHTWKIYCLDKSTGTVIWDRTAHEGIPRAGRHIKATQASSTPVTDGRRVVALMGSEGLFAYDMEGALLWKQDLGVLNPGLWGGNSSGGLSCA